MAVDTILGGKHVPSPTETKVSGYVESDIPRTCGTCEYLEKGNLCKNHLVLRDSQIPLDRKTKLRIVNPVLGCCNQWQSSEAADDKAAKGKYKELLKEAAE